MTGLEVDESQIHRHEHTGLVILARQRIVDARGNFGRHHVLGSQRAEQAGGLCHKQ